MPVPSEVRLQTFTVVEYLLTMVFQQKGGSAEVASDNLVLRLIRSAPHGEATIACLSNIVADTGTCLLLNTRHRAVISVNLALSPAAPVFRADRHSSQLLPAPRPPESASGGERHPHPDFPPPPEHLCMPGRKRSPPPRGGGAQWGVAGQRGRGGGWGRGGGGGRGRRGGRGGGRLRGGL